MAKEKLSNKQFLLVVNGPSCGGKTSVSNALLERYSGIFNAQGDQIKWLISDYDSEIYRGVVHDMVLEIIKIALKNNLSVLKQGALYESEKLAEIAKEFNVPLFIANVSAPTEVLEKRFQERIEAKKDGVKKISNVDPERFAQLQKMYFETKVDSPLEFDSSIQTPEEIADTISEYIKAHI